MKAIFEKINEKIKEWRWANENPKIFYTFAMITLGVLLAVNISVDLFSPRKNNNNLFLHPYLYKKSSNVIDNLEKKEEEKEKMMQKIVEELRELSVKRDYGLLNSQDSIRIEFLYEQYNNIKNDKKN